MKLIEESLKKKKEILFLSRTLGRAGVGVSLISVLKNFNYKKFNVTLGIQYPEKTLENEVPSGVKVIYYGEIKSKCYQKIFDLKTRLGKKKNPIKRFFWHLLNKLEDFRMLYKVKKTFSGKYDTVNAYHQGVASKYVIKHIRAKKKILWYHSSVIEAPWHGKIFPKADEIVVSTENGKNIMVKEWGDRVAEKITIIPCFIPFEDIKRKATLYECAIKSKENSCSIFTCGRLSNEKGIDLAIEAAKILKDKMCNFIWIIIGSGQLEKELREKVQQLDLCENVKLLGFKENPYPYFKACDICVSPSKLENYGLTIMEALVFEKPVVATKTLGGSSIIKDGFNGILADINSEAIAQAILKLMEDEELMQKIKQNIKETDYLSIQNKYIETLNKLEYCE